MNITIHAALYSGSRFVLIGALIIGGFALAKKTDFNQWIEVLVICALPIVVDQLVRLAFNRFIPASCPLCNSQCRLSMGKIGLQGMKSVGYRCFQCGARPTTGIKIA